jgi:hypothetical protein
MSWAGKALAGLLLICAALAGVVGYLDHRDDKAERRGVDKQVGLDIAKANQEIATRRERDATFDKMDARRHCLDVDLEWVFENGKSFCR